MQPHRQKPTRLPCPWDSPGKNTGVGCHFLLQRMKVKRESKVAQSCLTLSDPMDRSPPGSSVHGIFQARVLEWGAIAFSNFLGMKLQIKIPYSRKFSLAGSSWKKWHKENHFLKNQLLTFLNFCLHWGWPNCKVWGQGPQGCPHFWYQLQVQGGSQTTLSFENSIQGLTELTKAINSELWLIMGNATENQPKEEKHRTKSERVSMQCSHCP